jgi:hypothetical protein
VTAGAVHRQHAGLSLLPQRFGRDGAQHRAQIRAPSQVQHARLAIDHLTDVSWDLSGEDRHSCGTSDCLALNMRFAVAPENNLRADLA